MPAFLSKRLGQGDVLGADLLIVPVAGSPHQAAPRLAPLGRGIAESCARAVDLGDFDAKFGSRLVLHTRRIESYPRLMLLGLGDADALTPALIRRAFTGAARELLHKDIDSVAIETADLGSGKALAGAVAAAVDGIHDGVFRWTAATKDRDKSPGRFAFLARTARDDARVGEGVEEGRKLGEAVLLARELSDTPANHMGPAELAGRARALAKETGLKVKVLDRAQLVREKMEAMLAVGDGSPRPPSLIVLEHDPGIGGDPLVLVGKGLVYDTGGLSIKPTSSMVWMKHDKCGGCAVLGAMCAIATRNLPQRVIGVVPAVENSVSGTSYRPGDIIGSRSGKTIDVQNTDAEGRLALADALHYAIDKYSPAAVIDVATLTGAVYVALSDHTCGLLGNDDALIERVRAAGDRVGERAWPLPLWPEHRKDISSAHADIRNTGAQGGGAITAAAFLQEFVGDVPWAHLDIAGVARDRRNSRNGATGFGVRLLTEVVASWPKRRVRKKRAR